jgi:NADP-dependent 3-hydroxy acid dehydrogenase YdfG
VRGCRATVISASIAFAIEQPSDVEIGEITIRPTVQG